jgi:hypothetical protein
MSSKKATPFSIVMHKKYVAGHVLCKRPHCPEARDYALCGVYIPHGEHIAYGQTAGENDFPRYVCHICISIALEVDSARFNKFVENWRDNKAMIINSGKAGLGGDCLPVTTALRKETSMPNSLDAVRGNANVRIGATVLRSTLLVGDLYQTKRGGRTYMHTGNRTRPPSGSKTAVQVVVNGRTVASHDSDNFKTIKHVGGKEVIAFQSIVVKASADGRGIKTGEDGAVVTFEDKNVIYAGRAEIVLPA